VADMLAILVSRARNNNMISGLVPHLLDDWLSILQYANDTILFIEDDIE
jgi:hypothetical protein